MKVTVGRFSRWVITAIFLAGLSLAHAQGNSGAFTVALTGTLPESLTLSLSANTVNFALTSGSAANPGSIGITATTKWGLKAGRTALAVDAYFTSAAAALTDGAGDNIPSSSFKIADNGGASTALTNSVAFGAASAGLQLANVAITAANRFGTRTDAMTFNIDLSPVALRQLPAAIYTGTLNIQAQATP